MTTKFKPESANRWSDEVWDRIATPEVIEAYKRVDELNARSAARAAVRAGGQVLSAAMAADFAGLWASFRDDVHTRPYGVLDGLLEYGPDKHPGAAIICAMIGMLPGRVPKTVAALLPILSRVLRTMRASTSGGVLTAALMSIPAMVAAAVAWLRDHVTIQRTLLAGV